MKTQSHCRTRAECRAHELIRIQAFRAKRLARAGDHERGTPYATDKLKRFHASFTDENALTGKGGIEWVQSGHLRRFLEVRPTIAIGAKGRRRIDCTMVLGASSADSGPAVRGTWCNTIVQ